ncbi:hypothetical protein ACVNF4_11895 [Streptomyces sp. S6]
MDVLVCGGCGAELTVPVEEVALPVHAGQQVAGGAGPPSGRGRRLDASVWLYLAFMPPDRDVLPVPASGGLPEGVWRDHPTPDRPYRVPLRPDQRVFRRRLARHPAVRRPWLRAVHDQGWRGGWGF